MNSLSSTCLRIVLGVVCAFFPISASSATFSLNVSVNGSGAVSKNPNLNSYPSGGVVTLTATPSNRWVFSSWSGDLVGNSNPANVSMDSAKAITANFAELPLYSLQTDTTGQGTVSLDPTGGSYLSNTTVTASAVPATNWIFHGWVGALLGTTTPATVIMDSSKSINAVFVEPARIDQPPKDTSVEVGQDATLGVVAGGMPPLLYQWSFNGSPISEATNSTLNLTNVQGSSGGFYLVSVSNQYGSVASAPVRLTVDGGCAGTNLVTECTDSALRAAMTIGGVVTLCCNGTLALTNTIVVTNHVILDAKGHDVVVDGNNAVRLFKISAGASLEIRNLAFTGGSATNYGGAFHNEGTLHLVDCVVTNNRVEAGLAPAIGGAIYNSGKLSIEDSVLSGNIASGGPANGGAIGSLFGSVGIYRTQVLSNTVVGSRIHANQGGLASGGGIYLNGATAVVSDSCIASNICMSKAGVFGGAIHVESGHLQIDRTLVAFNKINGDFPPQLSVGGRALGGGISSKGTIRILRSTLFSNSSETGWGAAADVAGNSSGGGGFFNEGLGTLIASTIVSNSTTGGTGGRSGPNTYHPSGNGYGGGVLNRGTLWMTNCTIALNAALGGTPLLPNDNPGSGYGGGIMGLSGTAYLMNVTVASNLARAFNWNGSELPLGAGANIGSETGSITLRNTLVAYPGNKSNASGTITDDGFNFSSDGSCQFSSGTSFNFTDPKLTTLAKNGGPTLTMLLADDSPALNYGSPLGAPADDQRGYLRTFGSGVDVGATELDADVSVPRLRIDLIGSAAVVEFEAQAGITYNLHVSTNATSWSLRETIAPAQTTGPVTRSVDVGSPPIELFRLESTGP